MSDEEEVKARIRGEVVGEEASAQDIPAPYFFSQDDKLFQDVDGDQDLRQIKHLYSPLTRLTKMNTKDLRKYQIQVDRIIGNLIIGMKRKAYSQGRWAKLKSTGMFLNTVINDSHKGFKMTILSRLRKEIIVSPEKKKGRWPFRKE